MINVSQNKVLVIALLGIACAIVIFSRDTELPAAKNNIEQAPDKPEAFIEGARFKLYDKNGFSTTLNSHKALFYKEADDVEIESPELRLTKPNGDIIELSAQTGKLQPKNEVLTLSGQVEINQIFPPDKTWSIRGSEFLIDNKQSFISSDQAVTIRKDQNTIHALGLEAWLDERRIELVGKVRGQYAFSK